LVAPYEQKETEMEKHPYDVLIEKVADKMQEHEEDNLGFGIFEKVDKDLGLCVFLVKTWYKISDNFIKKVLGKDEN
jgi:hypothetical protein